MRRAVPFALIVLLAGCGDDDKSDEAATTTTQSTTTTTEAATTTTAESTTTTTCPPATTSLPEVGRADLDGDGVDEVWRSVGSGASTEIVELHVVVECAEVAVLLDGLPAQFPIGGTVTHLDGVRCDGGDVVHLSATSEDGVTYAGTETTYELRDGALVQTAQAPSPSTGPDPAYSTFEC